MRFTGDQLKMKALLALEEGVQEVRAGRAPASFAIRFALAYLYAIGEGERWLFESYWRSVTGAAGQEQSSPAIARVVRQTGADTALNGIYRSVGIERTSEVQQSARSAMVSPKPPSPSA